MAMNFATGWFIPTEEVKEFVLPLIREMFNLTEDHQVLEDMRLDVMGNGSGILTIKLLHQVDKEDMQRLMDATQRVAAVRAARTEGGE